MDSFIMLDVLMLFSFAYILLCGITGKGKIYDDSTIHPTRRSDYYRAIRLFSIIDGILGVASVLVYRYLSSTVGIVLFGVTFLGIVAVIIVIWPMNKDRVNKVGSKNKRNRKGE